MWDPFAEFVHKKIKDGVDIYASHWPDRPGERVKIIVHAGAMQDEPGREGTAHLLEHVIRYGGKESGAEKNHRFLSDRGGSMGMQTGILATEYDFFGPAEKKYFAESLALVGKFIFNFSIKGKLIDIESGIAKAEYRKSNPWQYEMIKKMAEDKILFSGTPLERCILPIEGLPEIIDRVSAKDLSAFHRQYYVPANISILAVGKLPIDDVFQLIEKSIFSATGGCRVSLPKPIAELPPLSKNSLDFSISEFLKKSAGVNISRLKISAVLPGTISSAAMKICADMIEDDIGSEICQEFACLYKTDTEWISYNALNHITIELADLPADMLITAKRSVTKELLELSNDKRLFKHIQQTCLNQLKILDYSIESLVEEATNKIIENHRLPTATEISRELKSVTMKDVHEVFSHLTPNRLLITSQRI
jgi:secreted Zn-dependent insulinase-like peptidase